MPLTTGREPRFKGTTALAAHKGADGLFQLCAGRGALADIRPFGMIMEAAISGYNRLRHTAGKAVCGGSNIPVPYTPRSVFAITEKAALPPFAWNTLE